MISGTYSQIAKTKIVAHKRQNSGMRRQFTNEEGEWQCKGKLHFLGNFGGKKEKCITNKGE